MFEHTVSEETERVKRTDYWSATIVGYDVIITRYDDGRTNLSIFRSVPEKPRLGLVSCTPRNVDELDAFARDATELFSAIAAGLREAGMSDLRSKWDMQDEVIARMSQRIQEGRLGPDC